MNWMAISQSLLLLLAANGAPIMARKLLCGRFAYPLDGGRHFFDGRRWLGRSKTWRGVLAALLLTSLVAKLLGLPVGLGFCFAALTLVGDLVASFCKRRLSYLESSHAPGLDTVPESLLPLWLLQDELALSNMDMVVACAVFFFLGEGLSPLLYRWHLRRRPY